MRVVAVLLLSGLLSSSRPPTEPVLLRFEQPGRVEHAVQQQIERRTATGDLDAAFQLVTLRLARQRPWRVADHRPDLEDLAGRGHAGAAALLASTYRDGRGGLPRDHDEAARWLARAAELGDEGAARDLAAYDAFVAR